MNITHPAIAYVDLNALRYNLQHIKTLAPHSKVLAMVKSNAYGHGAVEIARALEDNVDAFGVVFLKEALPLRAAGIKKPIIILAGFFSVDELQIIVERGFSTVVHSFEQLKILEEVTRTQKIAQPLSVWCKIDTGMHRLGFQLRHLYDACAALMANPMVRKPLHFITHFSDADDVTKEKTKQQIANFQQIIADLELDGEKSLANSSAIINYAAPAQSDFIRPGITLYGASPLAYCVATGGGAGDDGNGGGDGDRNDGGNDDGSGGAPPVCGIDLGLQPVMTLTARIIAIHDLPKGDTVGYGSTWECPEAMRVGIVSIGYGDGYPRNTRSGTSVLINGVRCQLIGRVAMDMITVDLRPVPDAKVGDVAVLWGKELPIEEVAAGSDTVAYELFCRMTARVYREYVF